MTTSDFRARMSNVDTPVNTVPHTWDHRRNCLKQHVLRDDLSRFIRWPVVQEALFSGETPVRRLELDHLKRSGRWPAYSKALAENWIGDPPPLSFYPKSSGHAVHLLQHLSTWEGIMGKNVDQMRSIYEFGSGYGLLPLMIARLGFTGKYVIQDLPEFLLLQEWYLGQAPESRTMTLEYTSTVPRMEPDLMIGLTSLSEVPLGLRDQVFESVRTRNILIRYQVSWDGNDNTQYFKGLGYESTIVQDRDSNLAYYLAREKIK